MPVRVDLHRAQVREVAGLDQHAAQAEHFDRFGNDLRDARAFDDHIRAAAVGQVADRLEALRRCGRRGVDGGVGAEPLRHGEPVRGEIDRHDRAGAKHAGFHQEAHAQ